MSDEKTADNTSVVCRVTGSSNSKVTRFQFPEDVLRKDEWIDAYGLLSGTDVSNAASCSKHFRRRYTTFTDTDISLISSRVPSLQLYIECADVTADQSKFTAVTPTAIVEHTATYPSTTKRLSINVEKSATSVREKESSNNASTGVSAKQAESAAVTPTATAECTATHASALEQSSIAIKHSVTSISEESCNSASTGISAELAESAAVIPTTTVECTTTDLLAANKISESVAEQPSVASKKSINSVRKKKLYNRAAISLPSATPPSHNVSHGRKRKIVANGRPPSKQQLLFVCASNKVKTTASSTLLLPSDSPQMFVSSNNVDNNGQIAYRLISPVATSSIQTSPLANSINDGRQVAYRLLPMTATKKVDNGRPAASSRVTLASTDTSQTLDLPNIAGNSSPLTTRSSTTILSSSSGKTVLSSNIDNGRRTVTSSAKSAVSTASTQTSISLNSIDYSHSISDRSESPTSVDSAKASRVKKKNCAPEFSNLNTMCLNAATNCIAKQRKRIRCLQQQLRRAHKEIENLRETLIDVLEKKLLAPDEDHDF